MKPPSLDLTRTKVPAAWRLAALCVVLATLVGCPSTAPTKRIVAFSEAVDVATGNVKSSFEAVDTAYFDAQVARLASNKQNVVAFKPAGFNTWIPEEELEVRMTLLKGLDNYADALADVMSNAQLDQFDKEAVDFGQQLVSLTSTSEFQALAGKRLDQNEVSILGTAVNAIGRWFINYKRGKEVKQIIADTDPHLQQVAAFLQKDFEALRTENTAAFNLQMQHLHGFINNNYDIFDPVTRYEQIRRLAQLVRQQRIADETLARAAGSMAKLAETHGKLQKAFDDDAFDLEASIRELIAEGKRVKETYDKLKSED